MKSENALVLLAGMVLLMSGCSIFGSGDPDYWPLAEGNCWFYRGIAIETRPDGTADTTVSEAPTIWQCACKTPMADGLEAWAMDVGDGDTVFFRNTDDFVFSFEDRSQTVPDTWLRLPLEEGRAWEYGGAAMLVRGKETVEVPAGTYRDCWKVQLLLGMSFKTHVWFAPDVGLVLTEMAFESEGYRYVSRSELTSVLLN